MKLNNLPYLKHINKTTIDDYNKFLLKKHYRYYQDENSSDNVNIINDQNKLDNLKKQLMTNNKLIASFNQQFESITHSNPTDTHNYTTYHQMVIQNIEHDNIRLQKVIILLEKYKEKRKKSFVKIDYLIITIIILYILLMIKIY